MMEYTIIATFVDKYTRQLNNEPSYGAFNYETEYEC